MGQVWNWLWLAVAFASELAALAALAHWGWVSGSGSGAGRMLLAVGAPAVAGVLWGVFAAPSAPVQVLALTVLVKVLVFGSAVGALVATGHPRLALVLAAAGAAGSLLSGPPTAAPQVTAAVTG